MSLPDWARAHGAPLFTAAIRTTPRDFEVEEQLGWGLSGDGEHDYLWIEKTGANTEWVARQLARHAGVAARDVGYAGLKDRHAVTRQWFSVPRRQAPDWAMLDVEGVKVLDVQRHARKLRRGAHEANRFRIVLRSSDVEDHQVAIGRRLDVIRQRGVPNYFGAQRFGRDGGNLALADAWADGRRLPRHKRSLAMSTARSFVFNELLDRRVRDQTWDRVLPGDVVSLDGSGSIFAVDEPDAAIERRCTELDIHPTVILPGEGTANLPSGHDDWIDALRRARVKEDRRAARLRVAGLRESIEADALVLEFRLGRGAFATSVLRELVRSAS